MCRSLPPLHDMSMCSDMCMRCRLHAACQPCHPWLKRKPCHHCCSAQGSVRAARCEHGWVFRHVSRGNS